MKHFKIYSLILVFIFLIPLLVSGQNEKKGDSAKRRTKKEFMQAWLSEKSFNKSVGGVPVISPFADWDYYYLHESIWWRPEAEHQNDYKAIEVPPGFVTDLTSVPKRFWSILPHTGRYAHPAIIHDYLYWTQILPRKDADKILQIGMKEMKVENWKVVVIYNAVRKFGESAWKKNAELKSKGEKRFLKKNPSDPRITWEEWKKQEGVFAD